MRKLIFTFLLSLSLTASLTAETKVLAFAGSTRTESHNKKLINEAAKIARTFGAQVTVIDLKDLPIPLYDGDEEAANGMPTHAKYLRNLMIESDAIMIASPDYNGSVPGGLKNALDWVSRSEDGNRSRDAFAGKKFAIMSASPGKGGGAGGLNHLRDILKDIRGVVIEKTISIPLADKAFGPSGTLEDQDLRMKLQEQIQQLLE